MSDTDGLSTLDGFKSSPAASGEIALLLLRSPSAGKRENPHWRGLRFPCGGRGGPILAAYAERV
jgi:hypothetical protein